MTQIIKNLSENPIYEDALIHCPLCGNKLYYKIYSMYYVDDGNTVYECDHHEDHVFWRHPFEEGSILHLNKNASETNFDSEQDFKFNGESWEILTKKSKLC